VNADLAIAPRHATAPSGPELVPELAPTPDCQLRPARVEDAAQIHALIAAHLEEGHLLPRRLEELTVHASRFVVAAQAGRIVGGAELAPLSRSVAEVGSLVVDRDARHDRVGQRLVHELVRRARLDGFDRLCAFTHNPGFFVRLGFSIVPHHWVREKIIVDCQDCALFRTCGQYAVVLTLQRQPARPS
jgi:amino-acid N-acetyltransferase